MTNISGAIRLYAELPPTIPVELLLLTLGGVELFCAGEGLLEFCGGDGTLL
jgi:hypothetical protein